MIGIIRKIQNYFADQVDVGQQVQSYVGSDFSAMPNSFVGELDGQSVPIEAYIDSATALHFGMPTKKH